MRSCRSLCSMLCLEFPKATYHSKVVVHPPSACYCSSWRSLHQLLAAYSNSTSYVSSFAPKLAWACVPYVMKHIPLSSSTGLSASFEDDSIVFFHLMRPHAVIAMWPHILNIVGGVYVRERMWGWSSSCVSKHCLQCSADTSSIWVICEVRAPAEIIWWDDNGFTTVIWAPRSQWFIFNSAHSD